MKKVLIINACLREEKSRTLKIGQGVVAYLKEICEVEWVQLGELKPKALDKESMLERSKKIYSDDADKWALKFANADIIIVVAPFWDMSFPAILKNYLERISISGITFLDGKDSTIGNCKAEYMVYITTRGMDIKDDDERQQASPYLKAVSWLWGIKNFEMISEVNMDYVTNDICNLKIEHAINEGKELFEEILNDKIN